MAASLPTIPEVQYENMTGDQLATELSALTGRTVEQVKSEGVQATLVALHLTGALPEGREDPVRLARALSARLPL